MTNLAHSLLRSYHQCPDRAAVTLLFNAAPDQKITYRDLYSGSLRYMRALANRSIRPHEVVILILNHGPELVLAFFGAILQGAVPSIMPYLTEKLSPEHYRASLKSLFQITAPAAVVTSADFSPEVDEARRGSSVREILVSGEISPLLDNSSQVPPGLAHDPDNIVLLQHSSGTTGLQKGVALSHRAVFNQLESYGKALHLNDKDIIVSWLPLYHDMGLIAGFLLPILNRIPLVLMSPFDWVRAPYRLMQAISHYRGTLCWLPNFAYNFCAQKIRDRDLEGVDLSCLRAVSNCSEPMFLSSHEAFLRRFRRYGLQPGALATCYAMAENVFAVTQGGIDQPVNVDVISAEAMASQKIALSLPKSNGAIQPGKPRQVAMLSAGRPIENTQIKIVDERGRELPERYIGEIALRSNCMLTGYYRRPDLTEKAFMDGWYLTGDLGYIADGELYISGRKKDIIIVGGKNIYPQDLEQIANEVEGVHPGRVVAFGVFSENAGTEEIVIIAETDERDGQERSQIAEKIRLRVNHGTDVVVRTVKVVGRDWLIKTSSGKIARSANRDQYLKEFARE